MWLFSNKVMTLVVAFLLSVNSVFAQSPQEWGVDPVVLKKELLTSCASEGTGEHRKQCITDNSERYLSYWKNKEAETGEIAIRVCSSDALSSGSEGAKLLCFARQYIYLTEHPVPEYHYVANSLSFFQGGWVALCKRTSDFKRCINSKKVEYFKFVALYDNAIGSDGVALRDCLKAHTSSLYNIAFEKVNVCGTIIE